MKDAARDVGENQGKKSNPVCQGKKHGLYPIAMGSPRAFRHRSDVDFKRAPSGALWRQIVRGQTEGKEASWEES